MLAATLFSVLHVVGVVVLVVRPAESLGWTAWECAGVGALLGAVGSPGSRVTAAVA